MLKGRQQTNTYSACTFRGDSKGASCVAYGVQLQRHECGCLVHILYYLIVTVPIYYLRVILSKVKTGLNLFFISHGLKSVLLLENYV